MTENKTHLQVIAVNPLYGQVLVQSRNATSWVQSGLKIFSIAGQLVGELTDGLVKTRIINYRNQT